MFVAQQYSVSVFVDGARSRRIDCVVVDWSAQKSKAGIKFPEHLYLEFVLSATPSRLWYGLCWCQRRWGEVSNLLGVFGGGS